MNVGQEGEEQGSRGLSKNLIYLFSRPRVCHTLLLVTRRSFEQRGTNPSHWYVYLCVTQHLTHIQHSIHCITEQGHCTAERQDKHERKIETPGISAGIVVVSELANSIPSQTQLRHARQASYKAFHACLPPINPPCSCVVRIKVVVVVVVGVISRPPPFRLPTH
ncbi:hypothetical protein VTK26DRAFT_6356 [Humicola hyalothermophila]